MNKNFIGDKGWSGAFGQRLAEWVVRNKWGILAASVVLVGLTGWGMKNLAQTNDYRVWFSKDSPELKAFETLETSYSKSDNILMVIAPQDGNVFTRKTLADIEWVTQKSWKTPFSSRVDSITNFQKTDAKKDELKVHDLVKNSATLTDADLQSIRAYSLKEPALVKNLVSSRGHVAAVNITINLPNKSPTESSDVAAYVRNLKKELMLRDPNLKVYLTGVILLEVVDSELSAKDMQTLIPLMYIILLIGLGLLLRTVVGVFATLITITFAIVASLGISGWLGWPITAISAMAPAIIMTLAVSDCVHVLVTFYQQLRKGKPKQEAMMTAIRFNIYPSAITSLANLAGYAALNFSESPPFRQFGNIIAFGSAAELLLAFLIKTALMLVLPVRVKVSADPSTDDARPSPMEEGIASMVLRNRFRFLGVLTAATLFFGFFVLRNECNEEFTKYHTKAVELRRDSDYIAANLTGIMDLEYALDANEAGGIYRPDFLKDVERFTQWYRTQPEVESVSSITDVVKRVNQSMHRDDSKWYQIPSDRKELAQYLLLYEMSLPYGMDLTTFFNLDKSATRLIVRVKKITTNELIALDKRAKAWGEQNTTLFKGGKSYSGSVSMMFAQINYRMIGGMIQGFLFSFTMISLLLMLLFRSVKVGFLSLVPNLFPAVIAFGIWGMVDGQVGLCLAMVCASTIGVVVDSTIHLFYHYLAGRRELKLAPEQSVHHAFSRAGTAIVVTDSILVIGFGILVLSPFEFNWVMGLMTGMTIFFDIFVTLFLTVPVVLLFDRQDNAGGGTILNELKKEVSMMTSWMKVPFRKSGIPMLVMLLSATAMLGGRSVAKSNEDANQKGLEIATKAKKSEAGYHDYSANIKMILQDASGSSASPDLLRLSFLEAPGDGDKGLATFDAPGDVKGTSLLTFAHKHSADDQWLYLPSMHRVKRIAATNKSGPFMGSEFAFEDMSYEAVERYKYKFVKQDKCSLGSCFVVERIPLDPDSGYSKQLVYWDTKDLRTAKIEFFDRKGDALKTYEGSKFQKFAGRFWRPTHMVMSNQQTGRKTLVEWSGFHYRVGLTSRDFDTNSLQRIR